MWSDMDSGLPEVLPHELIGWLMLRRCNLSPQQRLNVLSSTGNSLKADDIEQALRGAEEELRIQEANPVGKGKGKHHRPNFWVEQGGEWGLLAAEDTEILEDNMEEVHWVGKDISAVYGIVPSTSSPTMSTAGADESRWTSAENGYWFQDDWGQFSFLVDSTTDGEYYTMRRQRHLLELE